MVDLGGVTATLGVSLSIAGTGFLHFRTHGLQIVTGRDDREKEQDDARHQQQAAA
jgi:hypothetical protein